MKATGLARSMGRETGRLSWRDRYYALRDRLLADPRFQRWAAAFPLTRPIARRRARALFDLGAGFVYSQVLLACVRLGLFDILAEGPKSLAALSQRLSLSREATLRLLRAAISLELVARRGDDRFGLGVHGAALLGNPGVAAMIEHHSLLYEDLRDPVALLRGESGATALKDYWSYARAAQPAAVASERVTDYSALMSASQSMVAAEVLAAYPLGRHRCLLDMGGGDGSFLSAVAERLPNLRMMLFDLPPVANLARRRFAAAGLSDRIQVTGGDFLADALPAGADVISLVRIIHDHDDDKALAILRAARQALPDDGTLLLVEPMAETPGAEPMGDAYFGLYLWAMGSGRPRTPAELFALLEAAGFSGARLISTQVPLITRIIAADPGP